jgi:hypothetical protein
MRHTPHAKPGLFLIRESLGLVLTSTALVQKVKMDLTRLDSSLTANCLPATCVLGGCSSVDMPAKWWGEGAVLAPSYLVWTTAKLPTTNYKSARLTSPMHQRHHQAQTHFPNPDIQPQLRPRTVCAPRNLINHQSRHTKPPLTAGRDPRGRRNGRLVASVPHLRETSLRAQPAARAQGPRPGHRIQHLRRSLRHRISRRQDPRLQQTQRRHLAPMRHMDGPRW